MSNECENDQHDQCDGDECACPCHAESEKATRAIDDVLEKSAGAVTTRDPRTIPYGGNKTAWQMDKESPERSYWAPPREAADLYHPTSPEYDERAGEIERAEQLGMGRVARILDATRRSLNGEKLPAPKPSGYCAAGRHAVHINSMSAEDQVRYRATAVCGPCSRGEGRGLRLSWPWRRRGT